MPHEYTSRQTRRHTPKAELPPHRRRRPLPTPGRSLYDGDVERIHHRVVDTLLGTLRAAAPEVGDGIDWALQNGAVQTSVNPWRALHAFARAESRDIFFRQWQGSRTWDRAVQMRALAGLLERISDRLTVDTAWLRRELENGADRRSVAARLIQRHRRELLAELPIVHRILTRYYHQGVSESRHDAPTWKQWNQTPPALKEHDKQHPFRALKAEPRRVGRSPGFPAIPGEQLPSMLAPIR